MPLDDKQIASGKDRPMTYYDVLRLDRDATTEEIKAAYYELAREHHPDVAGQDPEVGKRFALISEAYRVLSDQQRRYQYDRTLPQKSYPLRHPTPQKIWKEASDVVLLRSDRFGPLNQAMQATLPIGLDEHMLVLTIPGSERHLAGHMDTAANHNSILNALELVYGEQLEFRLIDGSTMQDWEELKGAETRAKAASRMAHDRGAAGPSRPGAADQPAPAPTPMKAIDAAWDDLIQRMHRQYQELPKRQYPQSKARFVRDIVGWIARTEEDLKYAADANEDAIDRGVARCVERLGATIDMPAVMIALLLDNFKRTGGR